MVEIVVLRVPFPNRFHLGKNHLEDTHEIIHADTLFSAWVNTFSLLYPPSELKAFIQMFDAGQLRISSAFHCLQYGKEDYLFFLPKPIVYQTFPPSLQKSWKAIKFISSSLWQRKHLAENLGKTTLGGTHALTEEERTIAGLDAQYLRKEDSIAYIKPVKEALYPKVQVHTDTQEGVFYHQANIQLQQIETEQGNRSFHFYFLMDHDLNLEEDGGKISYQKLKASLRLLADEGIGGERSVGCGTIEEICFYPGEKLGIPFQENQIGPWCSLAPIIPKTGEFASVDQSEFLIRGGGTVGRGGERERHRSQVRMIAEGALLSKPITGRLVDISPDRDGSILRNGLNFSLPFSHEKS